MPLNYKQSIELLTSQSKFSINLGLSRMENIAKIFGNPQDELKIIHVAGTNGKGSSCAMLAKILEDNGFKTGLFTSPHLTSYTERFKINFQNISEDDFAKYLELVETTAQKYDINLTEFEILTMMAFLYFRDKKTNFVLLEVGMGGRLDATNIIKKPVLTIITSISYDHLDRLGKTIEDIASEKAGILKENTPLIIGKNNLGYDTVVKKADSLGVKVFDVNKDFEIIDYENNIFSNSIKKYQLSLRGLNQGQNLALVDKACEYLNLDPTKSLSSVIWNSRFQYIKEKNLIIDAAHNPDAIRLLRDNLDRYYPNKNRVFLFGVLNTKDYKKVTDILFNSNDTVFVTDKFAYNAVDKTVLASEIKTKFPNINLKIIDIENINEFLEYKTDGIKICCGSFYICSYFYK